MNPYIADGTAGTKGKAATVTELFGEKPFACLQCASTKGYRAKSIATLKAHFKAHHQDFDWIDVEPSLDSTLEGAVGEENVDDQKVLAGQEPSEEVRDDKGGDAGAVRTENQTVIPPNPKKRKAGPTLESFWGRPSGGGNA